MLVIRFLRSGRTNQAFFRVVLTQKSNPPKSKFIRNLGWYNPKTKETSLDKEEILGWVKKGAKPSNSVAKLLIANKITDKNIVFIPDAPGKKKKKDESEKPKQDQAKVQGSDENVDEKQTGEAPENENTTESVEKESEENISEPSETDKKDGDEAEEKKQDDKKE